MTEPKVKARRWKGDTGVNLAAFAATAIAGLVINLAIAGVYGPSTLGVFAQLYAIYVIATQLAGLGVADSVQKHVAEYLVSGEQTKTIVVASLIVTTIAGGAAASLLALANELIGLVVGSAAVAAGVYYLAPGLLLFSVNKVLFATLNGEGRLRAYGAGQVIRAVAMTFALGVFIWWRLPGHAVGGIFTAAEAMVLLVLMVLVGRTLRGRQLVRNELLPWIRQHLTFGGRGLANALLLEVHLRVDVVMLSIFLSDDQVGIYAFAALFAEGLYQVPVVIRTVAYPTLVQLIATADYDASGRRPSMQVAQLARRLALLSVSLCACSALAIALAYPIFAPQTFAAQGYAVLLILLGGMVMYACFIPFDQLMLQSGFPGRQSALMIFSVLSNAIVNIVLIPSFGLPGAAVATVSSFVLTALALNWGTAVWLGYRRGILLHGLYPEHGTTVSTGQE